MARLLLSLAFVVSAAAAAQKAKVSAPRPIDVYKEKGRFAGWPANNGIWSWG